MESFGVERSTIAQLEVKMRRIRIPGIPEPCENVASPHTITFLDLHAISLKVRVVSERAGAISSTI